jgi:uncharacterized protein
MRSRCLAFLTAAVLTACASSAPVRFYTLAPIAPESRPTAAADTIPVRLNRVTVPGELDRVQIVRRLDATRLQIDDQDRWAAPMDEMIRRVLTADLTERLAPHLVADANESAGGDRVQTLGVDIQEFYADPSCTVTLRATWVLTPPQTQGKSPDAAAPGKQRNEETQVPAAGCSGVNAVPESMSRALALLSDRIATAIAAPTAAR